MYHLSLRKPLLILDQNVKGQGHKSGLFTNSFLDDNSSQNQLIVSNNLWFKGSKIKFSVMGHSCLNLFPASNSSLNQVVFNTSLMNADPCKFWDEKVNGQ